MMPITGLTARRSASTSYSRPIGARSLGSACQRKRRAKPVGSGKMSVTCQKSKHCQCYSVQCSCDCHKRGI